MPSSKPTPLSQDPRLWIGLAGAITLLAMLPALPPRQDSPHSRWHLYIVATSQLAALQQTLDKEGFTLHNLEANIWEITLRDQGPRLVRSAGEPILPSSFGWQVCLTTYSFPADRFHFLPIADRSTWLEL